jgi:exonuclease III
MLNLSFLIASWNIRGLNDIDKCKDVLAELTDLKPSISLLQETKLNACDPIKAKSFLPHICDQFEILPSIGTRGGMINAFSSRLFNLQSTKRSAYTLTIALRTHLSPSEIWVTNVYAPTEHTLKQSFLDELKSIAPTTAIPWIILGDFNLMRFSTDKNNNNFRQTEADSFNNTINSLSLIELPLLDRAYTWSSNRQNPTLQKIDRAFINLEWANTFPNSSISSLTRFVSDHVPIVAAISTSVSRPAFFRFENYWASHQACRNIVHDTWAAPQSNNDVGRGLVSNLKKTRFALKTWRRSLLPPHLAETNCKLVISYLDLIEEHRQLSSPEFSLRHVLIRSLRRALRSRVDHWKTRSKIKFAIDGDENTKYFHICASNQLRNNKISIIELNGAEFSNHAQKTDILTSYYTQLLGTTSNPSWHFHLHDLYQPIPHLLRHLDDPFYLDEITAAFFGMNATASPGPDGFGPGFYRKF